MVLEKQVFIRNHIYYSERSIIQKILVFWDSCEIYFLWIHCFTRSVFNIHFYIIRKKRRQYLKSHFKGWIWISRILKLNCVIRIDHFRNFIIGSNEKVSLLWILINQTFINIFSIFWNLWIIYAIIKKFKFKIRFRWTITIFKMDSIGSSFWNLPNFSSNWNRIS